MSPARFERLRSFALHVPLGAIWPKAFCRTLAETLSSTIISVFLDFERFRLTLESVPALIIPVVAKKTSQNSSLSASQLAHLAGVSTDTLRHYERKGLLESRRSPNGYREYSQDCVDRMRLIRNALAIGFGLDDLAAILKIRDSGGAPCRQVRTRAAAKLDELETLLREMTILRDEMRRLLVDWDQRLESTSDNAPARLLESLSNSNLAGAPSRLHVKSLSPKRNLQKEKE